MNRFSLEKSIDDFGAEWWEVVEYGTMWLCTCPQRAAAERVVAALQLAEGE